jgi:hypothetical protein
MDLNTLATNLRSQASATSTIVIDKTVFPDSTLDSIRAAFALAAGTNLTIAGVKANDIKDPVDGVLKIKAGTASVLKQTKIPVALTFNMSDGALEAIIVTDLGDSWKFADSFTGLDTFPFNLIETSHVHFIYTNSKHAPAYTSSDEPPQTISLAPGLNFLSRVTFKHFETLNKLLGQLIAEPSLKFYGALETTTGNSLPAGTLRAALKEGSIKVGVEPFELTLHNPALALRITAAGEDDALQLAAGERSGVAIAQVCDLNTRQRAFNAR